MTEFEDHVRTPSYVVDIVVECCFEGSKVVFSDIGVLALSDADSIPGIWSVRTQVCILASIFAKEALDWIPGSRRLSYRGAR